MKNRKRLTRSIAVALFAAVAIATDGANHWRLSRQRVMVLAALTPLLALTIIVLIQPPESTSQVSASAPSAVLWVGLSHRANDARGAWNPRNDTYSSDYINPASQKLQLTACASRGGSGPGGEAIPIRQFIFYLRPLG